MDGDATWVSRQHREIEGGSTGAGCHRCVPRREATLIVPTRPAHRRFPGTSRSVRAPGARRAQSPRLLPSRSADPCLLPVHGGYVRIGPVVQQEGEVDDQDGSQRTRVSRYSTRLQAGEVAVVVQPHLHQPGSYEYWCLIHAAWGIVQRSSWSDARTLSNWQLPIG